ncbi:MAG: hypothetical protein PUP93_31075 [Rhizonema sp. NSF051]|nr:hypothetical protein [Rhizonema sp. NSF051]
MAQQRGYRVVQWLKHNGKDYLPNSILFAEPEEVESALKVGALYEDPSAIPPLIITPPNVPLNPVAEVVTPPVVTSTTEIPITPVVTTPTPTAKSK